MALKNSKFSFVKPDDLDHIYALCLQKAKQYKTVLFTELKVHDSHKEAIGYWTSPKDMFTEFKVPYNLPYLENAIVVPFYHPDYTIANLRFIFKDKERYDFLSLGTSPAGWFNLLPTMKDFEMRDLHDKTVRVVVHDKLLAALRSNMGIYSEVINDSNLACIKTLTSRISIHGSKEFLNKWLSLEGFDIVVGSGPHATNLPDYLTKNFCVEELMGLDERAIIPRALEHAKTLPTYERLRFNEEFKKIHKQDLRNVAPHLFENYQQEKLLVGKIKEWLREKFKGGLKYSWSDDGQISLNFAKRKAMKFGTTDTMKFGLWLCNDVIEGDLIEHVFSLGGIPSDYYFDRTFSTRLPSHTIFSKLSELYFITFMGMLHELQKTS